MSREAHILIYILDIGWLDFWHSAGRARMEITNFAYYPRGRTREFCFHRGFYFHQQNSLNLLIFWPEALKVSLQMNKMNDTIIFR